MGPFLTTNEAPLRVASIVSSICCPTEQSALPPLPRCTSTKHSVRVQFNVTHYYYYWTAALRLPVLAIDCALLASYEEYRMIRTSALHRDLNSLQHYSKPILFV